MVTIGAAVERLEQRVHFADGTPPTLETVRLLGPTPGQAAGIALTFSEPLDPARATDVGAYEVRGAWRVTPTEDIGFRRLQIASAAYDDATRTVTLTPDTVPFDANRYVRDLIVNGGKVTDASGTPLDGDGDGTGGGDAFRSFAPVHKGRTIKYRDASGSRVKVRLSGPGRLRLFRELQRFPWGDGVQLFVDGATPASVVTGTVRPRPGGGGATTPLVEIINPGGARLDLLSNGSFQVTG